MKVSYSADKPKENKFFGDSHFWRPTAKYLSYGKNDPNIIIVSIYAKGSLLPLSISNIEGMSLSKANLISLIFTS